MPSYADILVQAKTRLSEVLASPTPSYTENGKTWDWNGYQKMLLDKIETLEKLVQYEQGPLELTTQAVT